MSRHPRLDEGRRRAPDGRPYVPSAIRWAKAAEAHRPYPVEDLAPVLGISRDDERLTSKIARALGLNRTTVRRYRRIGLTREQAEAWSARADAHPASVWARWEQGDDGDEAPAPSWMSV